jgi:DNA polymerase-3 subunit gamma/tau
LRDALTLLEQVTAFSAEEINESDVRLVLGTVSRELLWELMDGIAARDAAAGLTAIERATEEGVSFSQLTRDLVSYSRDLLLLTVGFEGESGLSDAEKKRRHAHANAIGRARLTDLGGSPARRRKGNAPEH